MGYDMNKVDSSVSTIDYIKSQFSERNSTVLALEKDPKVDTTFYVAAKFEEEVVGFVVYANRVGNSLSMKVVCETEGPNAKSRAASSNLIGCLSSTASEDANSWRKMCLKRAKG